MSDQEREKLLAWLEERIALYDKKIKRLKIAISVRSADGRTYNDLREYRSWIKAYKEVKAYLESESEGNDDESHSTL